MHVDCAAPPRVLIADDQPDLLDALQLLLKGEGILFRTVKSPDATVAALMEGGFDLLLMDLNYTSDTTSGREGIDLLSRVRALDELLPVVVMTGWGSVDLAVEAMRRGVRDFVQKPWANGELLTTLRREIDSGRLRRQQAAGAAREIAEARRIQQNLLPSTLPRLDGVDLAASWRPASGVGGDCFDLLAFDAHHLALAIADVVGKGIPAALLMSNLQATVRAFATSATPPSELCLRVNRILCGHIGDGRFITFFYGLVNAATGTLTYANAGHLPPILVRRDGTVERLTEGGPVLGVLPDAAYGQATTTVGAGDRLVLYTDGITEACNDADEEFGDERLLDTIAAHRGCGAAALQERVEEAVARFSGRRSQDDATIIVLAM